MKVLVTGVTGQLGHDVMKELEKRGYDAIGTCRSVDVAYVQMDITDAYNVSEVFERYKPDAVIHCAAWTNVDDAESEQNKEDVYAINVNGTQNIANACKSIDCKMIYISTDYVFNGQGEIPWLPDCVNCTPLNHYGKTKLEGEFAVSNTLDKYFIVRISWVFGENGKNFVKTMLDAGRKFGALKVINDQIGTPTYTCDLSRLLVDMIETDRYGCYHATNAGGYISWYDFAREIFSQAATLGYAEKVVVIPVTTKEYGISKAARPFNSRLDTSSLAANGFEQLPTWKDALARYLETIKF